GEGTLALLPTDPVAHPYTEDFSLQLQPGVEVQEVYDPQNIVRSQNGEQFKLMQNAHKGTFFVKLHQGEMIWWQAVNIHLEEPIDTEFVHRNQQHYIVLKNRTAKKLTTHIESTGIQKEVELAASGSEEIAIPASALTMGTNTVEVRLGKHQWTARYVVWDIENQGQYQPQDLSDYYNARVRDIFEQRYLSPRPDVPTLQLPWQGIGNWCHPLTETTIDDSGLMAARQEQLRTYLRIPF